MNPARFKSRLKSRIDRRRFAHSLRTALWAQKIARLCGADETAAYIAGLLHDCERSNSDAQLLAKAQKYHLRLTARYKKNPVLLHCPLGARTAEQEFGVKDRHILNAIRHHTLGCKYMSRLEKIIFVADYTEPGRQFPAAKAIRRQFLQDRDLARAVLSKRRHMLKYQNTCSQKPRKGS
jgi:predicted HD superfamily hydrolase involved in NAD metabolism